MHAASLTKSSFWNAFIRHTPAIRDLDNATSPQTLSRPLAPIFHTRLVAKALGTDLHRDQERFDRSMLAMRAEKRVTKEISRIGLPSLQIRLPYILAIVIDLSPARDLCILNQMNRRPYTLYHHACATSLTRRDFAPPRGMLRGDFLTSPY